jgi:type IV pilus assembly protein PilO
MAIDFKNQRNQLMLIAIIASLGAAYLYWDYVYGPKSEELAAVEARVATLDDLNAKAKQDVAGGNVQKLKEQNEALMAQLVVMRQLVPTGNEVPVLLDQVSTAARQVGLDLADVAPQPVTTGEQFDIYRYRIGLAGDYHTIGQFLANVGSMSRIVVPMNLTLQGAARNPRPRAERAHLDARMEIQTFVSKTSPGALPAAGEGAR